MATTAIWNIKGRLSTVINYAENPNKTEIPNYDDQERNSLCDVMDYAMQDYKTERRYYVSGINCFADTARAQMMLSKKRFGKTDGNIAYHGYQSFAKGEVTPEIAHEIGIKLGRGLWGDRFEVVVATHLDKDCIHNHFVINSVSFIDGKKYNDCKATYRLMREESDRLCQEYNLSIINSPTTKGKHYSEWMAEQQGKPTWRSLIRQDIDEALSSSFTYAQLISNLKMKGYSVKTDVKYLAVRPEGKERYVRLRSLGSSYTQEALQTRLLEGEKHPHFYKGNAFQAFQKSSLRGLYYHYLYALGILKSKHKGSSNEVPFFVREKLLIEDDMAREYQLLSKNNIDSYEQLSIYQSACAEKIITLSAMEKASTMGSEKTKISKQIKTLKKEVCDCEHIAARSVEMIREQKEHSEKQEHSREEKENHVKQRSS